MRDNSGLTLIELLIVISIIGVLAVALGIQFIGWQRNYNIESEVKQIYVDLMNARLRAMQRNRFHFVIFPTTTSYSVYEDTNPPPDGNSFLDIGSDTQLPPFPKTVTDAVTWAGGQISLDKRGTVTVQAPPADPAKSPTLCVASIYDPDYNCIMISPTRIKMGKLTVKMTDGGPCDSDNCNAK